MRISDFLMCAGFLYTMYVIKFAYFLLLFCLMSFLLLEPKNLEGRGKSLPPTHLHTLYILELKILFVQIGKQNLPLQNVLLWHDNCFKEQ